MSARDFQLAFAGLISSPEACYEALSDEEGYFSSYDLTIKEKKRLQSILHQRGISACCSLYRMNRVTPVYSQLSNSCTLLGDRLILLVEEFWQYLSKPSLQFKEEVLGFGNFVMKKIEGGLISIPFLKEILTLEMAMNELSYLPEGEFRILRFEHDIFRVLHALITGKLAQSSIPVSPSSYKLYIKDHQLAMDIIGDVQTV